MQTLLCLMNTTALPEGDVAAVLTELELRIARRADELKARDEGTSPHRDFWREAENEIWTGDGRLLQWSRAG